MTFSALVLMITVWVIVTVFMLTFLIKVIRKPMRDRASEEDITGS